MIGAIKQTIMAGLVQLFPAKLGLHSLVFGKAIESTYDTETILIDIYDGKRGTAGYTARDAKGQTVGLDGWDTTSVTPPLIDENFNVTARDLKLRGFGESEFSKKGKIKLKNIIDRQLSKILNREQRAYTRQIADLITTGKMTIIEKDDKGNTKAAREIDFKMPATHIYSAPLSWANNGTDIIKDIENAGKLIVKDSGLTGNIAICGENTIDYIINNTKIQSLLDNRRVEFGGLVKEELDNGLTYWGTLFGKKIYTFTDFDENGDPYIPNNAFCLFSNNAELDIAFGSLDVLKNGVPAVVESKKVIGTIPQEEPPAIKVTSKSAKLYCLTQSSAFVCITTD